MNPKYLCFWRKAKKSLRKVKNRMYTQIKYFYFRRKTEKILKEAERKGYIEPEILYGFDEAIGNFFIQVIVNSKDGNINMDLGISDNIDVMAPNYAVKLSHDLKIPCVEF